MGLCITTAIQTPCENKFLSMLREGAFPEVGFSESEKGSAHKWQSYNMVNYSIVWARFMRYVDNKMRETVDQELGVFTRKRSKKVIAELEKILSEITETAVSETKDRFATWVD